MFGTRSPFKGWPKTSVLRKNKGVIIRARVRTPFLAKQYRWLVKWGWLATAALCVWHSNFFEMTGNFIGNTLAEAQRNGTFARTPELFGYYLKSLRLTQQGEDCLILAVLGTAGLYFILKRRVSIRVTHDRVRLMHEGPLFRTYDLMNVQRFSVEPHPGALREEYREARKGRVRPQIYRNAAWVVMWYGGGSVRVCSVYPRDTAERFCDRLNQVLVMMKNQKPHLTVTEMTVAYAK